MQVCISMYKNATTENVRIHAPTHIQADIRTDRTDGCRAGHTDGRRAGRQSHNVHVHERERDMYECVYVYTEESRLFLLETSSAFDSVTCKTKADAKNLYPEARNATNSEASQDPLNLQWFPEHS